jgi:hypothetical protein
MNHNENGTIAVGAPNSIMRKLTSLPEPVESLTRYDVSTSTPWGTAQTAKSFGVGIVMYTTASHGGFHVSSTLLRQMAEDMRGDAYAPLGWFEEDCAWSMVVLSFPERFSVSDRLAALDTLRSTYPQQYQRLCANAIQLDGVDPWTIAVDDFRR